MFPQINFGALAPTHLRGMIAGSFVLGGLCLSATGQSFSSAITFDEALQDYSHGDIVDPDACGTMLYYSPRITVTPPTSSLTKAVIFDTLDPQTAANTSDPDLIPNTRGNVKTQDLGNIIIIQENNGFTTTGNSIDNPYKMVDDDATGGTVTFDFNPDTNVTIDSLRLTFIDLEKQGDISFIFSDGSISKTISGSAIKVIPRLFMEMGTQMKPVFTRPQSLVLRRSTSFRSSRKLHSR